VNDGISTDREKVALVAAMGAVASTALFLTAPTYLSDFSNFAFYVFCSSISACVLWLAKARPATTAGALVAGSLCVILFQYAIAGSSREGLVWLGYLFALPGTLAGVLLLTLNRNRIDKSPLIIAGLFGFSAIAVGFLAALGGLCMTMMQCTR